MKLSFVVAGLLTASLCCSAMATTLKLSPEIDLLVVDGKKMSGSLLKGADSLELDNGQHQILFNVSKAVRSGSHDQVPYTSSPLIAAFDTQDIPHVAILLPRIDSERDGQKFDKNPNYRLVDQHGKPIAVRQDRLRIAGPLLIANLEKEMAQYNQAKHPASVPAFAIVAPPTALVAPTSINISGAAVTQRSVTLEGENVAEQMLQYWFQQADKATQQRFLDWAKDKKTK